MSSSSFRRSAAGVLFALVAAANASASPGGAGQSGPARPDTADAALSRAFDAMGGIEKLRRLQAVRIAGVEHTNMLEQSERPEGPYLVSYADFSELRDLASQRLAHTASARSIVQPRPLEMTTLVADGVAAMRFGERTGGGSADSVATAEDSLELGPERVLLNAAAASDVALRGRGRFQDTDHDVLTFTLGDRRVTLYLNAHTALPSAVEWVRDYPGGFFLSIWGDVTFRVEYSLWHLEPGGLMYPRQWTTSLNDLPYRDRTILECEVNPEVFDGAFAGVEEARDAFERRAASAPDAIPLGRDFGNQLNEGEEIAPGVTQIRGTWNVALIEQADGIVVLEAPISSAYSAKVLEEVAERFPGRSVKGVITTSDAWPHLGGVREYVARGVPVHAFEATLPMLGRLLATPRTARPDALARTPVEPDFRTVAERVSIGTGPTRLEILPIHGEGGERMLAVWFPEHRLLYASDLIQHGGASGEFFMPSYLAEVEALVKRHDLDVETVFAMHLSPTPLSEVQDALAEVRNAE